LVMCRLLFFGSRSQWLTLMSFGLWMRHRLAHQIAGQYLALPYLRWATKDRLSPRLTRCERW
jgi:hypothetical protein